MPAKPNPLPKSLTVSPSGQKEPSATSLQGRKSIVIGRGLDCDVVIKDPKASRHHCKLTRGETGFILEDLGSKNGTFVNAERISQPIALKPHQTFKIGDTMFYLG